MHRTNDVLVIGAGLSGLYAARRLQRSGVGVTIIEARDHVEGRVFSRKLANGATIDLGGQWIGPGQKRIYAFSLKWNSILTESAKIAKNVRPNKEHFIGQSITSNYDQRRISHGKLL